MKPLHLDEKSQLRSSTAKLVADSLNNPDAYIELLYDRARERQWSLDLMDWSQIDFSSIPRPIRQAAVNMFCQLNYGEMAAYIGSARMAEAAPNQATRQFFVLQTADEARHLQWFSSLIAKLDCEATILPSVQALMDDVSECDSIEELVVGMHIIIEGMAHSFFLEGTEAFSKASLLKPFMGDSYRSANVVFNDWLPNFLGKDEGRHLAFGIHFLRTRVADLSPARRERLEQKTQRWAELYQRAAADPNMLAVPGLDSAKILQRTTLRINNHLAQIGLQSRIAQ